MEIVPKNKFIYNYSALKGLPLDCSVYDHSAHFNGHLIMKCHILQTSCYTLSDVVHGQMCRNRIRTQDCIQKNVHYCKLAKPPRSLSVENNMFCGFSEWFVTLWMALI
jgi:hypothetical protein